LSGTVAAAIMGRFVEDYLKRAYSSFGKVHGYRAGRVNPDGMPGKELPTIPKAGWKKAPRLLAIAQGRKPPHHSNANPVGGAKKKKKLFVAASPKRG